MMRRARIALARASTSGRLLAAALTLVGIAAACGLELTGELDGGTGALDGSVDGASVDGAPEDALQGDAISADADAGPDAFEVCATQCDGGCDAATCVVACTTPGACKEGVKCPPGIPCDVSCSGADSCEAGVDCTQGSKCRISCSGPRSCAGSVDCAGTRCELGCTGDRTCNALVDCRARDCQIACGVGGGTGQFSCEAGVTCRSQDSCFIGCLADDACEGPIRAAAQNEAFVLCNEDRTCLGGVALRGGDAGIATKKPDSLTKPVFCDAGKCGATCAKSSYTFCCASQSCQVEPGGDCTITDAGCP
jgi:hypothetical protein